MYRTWHKIIALIVLAGMSACTPYIYVPLMPEPVNSPLLHEAGDAKLNATVYSTYQNVNVEGTYAISDHIAVTAAYRTVNYSVTNNYWKLFSTGGHIDTTRFTGHRFSFGLGYFTQIGTKGRLDLFGGYSNGTQRVDYMEQNNYQDPNYANFTLRLNTPGCYIQSSVGIDDPYYTLSLGCKAGYQNYPIKSEAFSGTPFIYGQGPYFVQPYADAKVGYKFVKLFVQEGLLCAGTYTLVNKNNTTPSVKLPTVGYLSVGLQIYFSRSFLR